MRCWRPPKRRCRRGCAVRQGSHGDELPAELRRESRLQKIGEAKAALEREAKNKAAEQPPRPSEAGRTRRRRAVHGQEEAWPQAVPRGRQPDLTRPARRHAQRTSPIRRAQSCRTALTRAFRAGLQRADRGRFRVAGDRGARLRRRRTTNSKLLPMIALIERIWNRSRRSQRRHGLFQRGERDR